MQSDQWQGTLSLSLWQRLQQALEVSPELPDLRTPHQ